MNVLKRLLGRDTEAGGISDQSVQTIVNAYGAIMKQGDSLIRNTAELPYPKRTIKRALMRALQLVSEPEMRTHLKTGYLALSEFQPLTLEEKDALAQWNEMVAGAGAGKRSAPEALVAARAISDAGALVKKLQEKIADEAQVLRKELRAAGFRDE
jgi:hypothetical protein